jgi:glucuronate isomerase
MKPFLGEDFLLTTEPARRLFHDYAKAMPILDYHNHLPPEQVADDARFGNLAQVWLGGDHYKWRLMRANGVPEAHITGHPADERTFQAWARTVTKAVGNPVHHWTHLELRRYFGIDEVLSEASAPKIWKAANEQLATPEFSVKNLLKKMNVVALCTTDDPADDLAHHKRHTGAPVMVPTFRPDKALIADAPGWAAYLVRLGKAAGVEIRTLKQLVHALELRHKAFHDVGGRVSDHALITPWATPAEGVNLEAVFQTLLAGKPATERETTALKTHLLLQVARLDAEKGWTMQLHLAAQRNLNTLMFGKLGPDTGYDAVSDEPVAQSLARFLDLAARDGTLPRTIVYGLNPASHDAVTSVLGAFQDGGVAGKMQLGSAWWFNDHIDGMDLQLRALANNGLLSRFVGMLTDSRSFLSFPRHEYFRRVLCRLVGGWVDEGLAPADYGLLGGLVQDVSFNNAKAFFGIPGV